MQVAGYETFDQKGGTIYQRAGLKTLAGISETNMAPLEVVLGKGKCNNLSIFSCSCSVSHPCYISSPIIIT